MYLTTRAFVDLEDNNYRYKQGEKYPRKGYKPSKERVEALTEGNNKAGLKLIKEVKAQKKGGKSPKK